MVKLADGFNGADLRNVCTEAGAGTTYASLRYKVKVVGLIIVDIVCFQACSRSDPSVTT